MIIKIIIIIIIKKSYGVKRFLNKALQGYRDDYEKRRNKNKEYIKYIKI